MLGLLLTILKIIGFILLAVLGLFLLLVFLLLLVPIRYRGKGSYYGKPEGSLRVTWLLHLLSVEIAYREELKLVIRVLGFCLFKEKGRKAKEDLIDEPMLAAQEVTKEVLDPKTETEMVGELGADGEREPGGTGSDREPGAEASEENSEEALLLELREEIDSLKSEIHSMEHSLDEDEKPSGNDHMERSSGSMERSSGDSGRKDDPPDAGKTGKTGKTGMTAKTGKTTKTGEAPKKKNFFSKLYARLTGLFRRLRLSFRLLADRGRLLLKKKEELSAFIQDEENKKTFRLLKKQTFKLLRHLLPRKLEGEVTFGFDDPYTTGQILTGAAFFYPLYHKHLFLTPVFDVEPGNTLVEGKLFFKGRIRAGTLLIIGLRLLLHKNFRALLKKFLNQGGN